MKEKDVRKGVIGWVDVMFQVQDRWDPEVHFVEGGQIWLAVKKFVYQEMSMRDRFLNIEVLTPIKDKATRGRSLQKHHRAGATRWNTKAEGFEGAKDEMLRFTGNAAARLDDQFDSCATLHLGLDSQPLLEEEDFESEEEYELHHSIPPGDEGRSSVTGY